MAAAVSPLLAAEVNSRPAFIAPTGSNSLHPASERAMNAKDRVRVACRPALAGVRSALAVYERGRDRGSPVAGTAAVLCRLVAHPYLGARGAAREV